MSKLGAKRLLVVALLCLTASASIAYFSITKYDIHDPATGGKNGDIAQYIRMYQGAPLTEIPKPYRYRLLTPFLARLVPWLPDSVAQFYQVDPDKIIKFKFGMVNMLGLGLAGFTLFLLCRALGFANLESLLGSYLFFASFFVVNYGAVPMVDALAYFFLVLGIWAALTRRPWLLFLAASLGMLQKETSILILLAVLLLAEAPKRKAKNAALCLPGVAAYFVFRFFILPTDTGFNYSPGLAWQGLANALTPGKIWVYFLIDGGLCFGVLWALAAHGLCSIWGQWRHPLCRLCLLLPLIAVVPFVLNTNLGRIWFLAFPVVIPLALVSLGRLFGRRTEAD